MSRVLLSDPVPPAPCECRTRGVLRRRALAVVLLYVIAGSAHAQSEPDARGLRGELEALKAEQARIAELQRRNDERIRGLERLLADEPPQRSPSAPPQPPAPALSPAPPIAAADAARLELSGDLRLRHERNFADHDGPRRNREVLRARLAARYALSDWLGIGARLATGDPDNPRSTSVTLSDFNDDFQVSLDQAYLRLDLGRWRIHGGKFPNPFLRTELVWDNDVNPQGLAAHYRRPLAGGRALRATGLYFAVDEQAAGDDSRMLGAQLGWESGIGGDWRHDAALAYYRYALDGVPDAGDLRSNLRAADGGYLSDFEMADVVAAATYAGWGEAWPLRVTGQYVKNLGAATDADTGYGVDLSLGRSADPGDWRLVYGHAAVRTDAVLAAFSQDNTTLATNYRQHAFAVDYVLRANTILNATWYRYRTLDDPEDAGPLDPGRWLNRVRFNFLVRF